MVSHATKGARAPREMNGAIGALVASTADPAYATTLGGRIVAWNAAATELLGHSERRAVGARCWGLLEGKDIFGNPLCGPACPLIRAVRRGVPVHRFVVRIRSAEGRHVCVRASVVTALAASGERAMIHLLGPCRCTDQVVEEVEDGGHAADPPPASARPPSVLSARECEILGLIARGQDTDEIAGALCLSVLTVRNHVKKILAKLGVHSRVAAVSAARANGIV